MRLWCVALIVLLGGCGFFGSTPQRTAATPERRAAPPAALTAAPAPAAAVERTSPPSTAAPQAAAARTKPQPPVAQAGRRPDGVAASNCVSTRRTNAFGSGLEVYAKNGCSVAIEVRAACLPSYAEPNEPYPGTYSLNSWLFTLGFGQEQPERQSAMCYRRGGKVLYASCHVGSPHFTAPDATKFGCFR